MKRLLDILCFMVIQVHVGVPEGNYLVYPRVTGRGLRFISAMLKK
jgi:hypothetical protein